MWIKKKKWNTERIDSVRSNISGKPGQLAKDIISRKPDQQDFWP